MTQDHDFRLLRMSHCLFHDTVCSSGIRCRKVGRSLKNGWKSYVEEVDVAYFNVLSLHKYEVADKIRTNLSLSSSIFEIRNS